VAERIFALDGQGYFQRHGQRVIPVGVNYWPGSCGVEMWQAWPEDEIRHDLDVLKDLGLNTIRFFLRWQDFEPEAEEYDTKQFQRLGQLLGWCRERELLVHPSLFVGWMSGGIFWPKWRAERNLFSDPFMIERSTSFARKATEAIEPYRDCVLAIDLGNELSCLPDSRQARPHEVRAWCAKTTWQIHEAWPEVLIVSGNEQGQFIGDNGWRLNDQPGCDVLSMHGYPVPAWHCLSFDGMTDPLAQSLLPFCTQVARAFGPVMVQEFGTILTAGQMQQDQYLQAMLPACWQAGSNGFLWWCLRDIKAAVHPYLRHGFEEYLGLVDDQDRVKPGMGFFLEFAREVQERPAPKVNPDAVGLYFPAHFYERDDGANPGNDPQTLAPRLTAANYALRQLGRGTRVVRGDAELPGNVKTLLVPGAIPAGDEAARLLDWVQAGGRLIWHGPVGSCWGHAVAELLGGRPADYRSPLPFTVEVFARRWSFRRHPQNIRLDVQISKAQPIACDSHGLPVVFHNACGQGLVICALPSVEDEFVAVCSDRSARSIWLDWYAGMLAAILPAIRERFDLSLPQGITLITISYITCNFIQVFLGHVRSDKKGVLFIPTGILLASLVCLCSFVPMNE